MIQIQTHAGQVGKHIVILTGKKQAQSVHLTEGNSEIVRQFRSTDKKFDFFKTADGFLFLVRTDQEAEELRKAGSKVKDLLSEEVEELFVDGPKEDVFNFTEGLLLASYQFLKYRSTKEKEALRLAQVYLSPEITKKQISELENQTKAVFWARDMVNEPVSGLNAEQLGEAILGLSEEAGIRTHTLGKTQIESLKMGGLLAVNKGSMDPPTFTIMEYKPAKPVNKKPIVLVGKGVVYDTGGLSLKPTAGSMDVMKSDMAGAAAVAGAIYLAALQKLNVHVVGLIPATDNRPGQNAYAPGDIITMFNGSTVEVLNTDAEGRMILADALSYSAKYKPELVVSVATLTGAAVRAIGTKATVAMGNADDKTFQQLEKAGAQVHERIVRLPFWDEYAEEMKSKIADLKNLGGPNAGMITAGKFLEHFTKHPYIHLDIAGPAWLDTKEDYKGQGGTGVGVRLLYNYLKKIK
jgi:leucyl aminopeptidase